MQIQLNNRYRVIRTLGGGGFGETFLAEDTQMPSNRRCVIKQLRPIQNNPQIYQLVQERFQREAAILEELGGATDQIPTLYAYFQTDGQFYLVQEWVEGDTLTAKVQQVGFLSESSVREILLNLLPILEYVHNKRIIHRDIKPDNIILRHRDGKPVLIDFGAVRESMGTVMNSQGNPTSSIVIGTPGFMPSEQAAGRPLYSSDLYSLGITAIYLLTGKQPQDLEIDSRTGEIIWHRHALSVSPTMAAVIDRAIAYHPRDRFATAREMLDTLHGAAIPATVPYIQPPVAVTTPVAPIQSPAVNIPPSPTLPNTVAVSPGTSSQSSNQGSGQRGIFLASLITGGLIGAAIIIGFALNRSPQSVTQSTTASDATTSTQAENTPTPTQSPVSSTPEPTPTNEEPRDIVTPLRSPFPSNSDSSPTPSVTQPQVERPSPEQAVQNYYATINQGEYQAAWNQLSPNYQNNRRLHPNGYLSYIDWWGERVQSVDVEQVNLVQANTETATVDAQFKYMMKSGKIVPGSVRFSLLWDAENSRWVVSDAN